MANSKLLVSVAAAGALVGIGIASAADLPRTYTKAPAVIADIYNWTGFYIGLEGGGDWGRSRHYQNDPAAAAAGERLGRTTNLGLAETGAIGLNGVLAGSTVGYNYQFSNNIVVGIENDFSWTHDKGGANLIPPFTNAVMAQTAQTWLDTLRGRIGYAWKRVLVYGTGGAAFAGEGILLCETIAAGCGNQSRIVIGWVAGAGAEYALVDNWSVKLEYLHADFGSQFYPRTYPPGHAVNGSTFFASRDVTLTDDIVRAGLNYQFGGGGRTKAPAAAAEIHNWTGFYIGVEGGGDWGHSQHYQDDSGTFFGSIFCPLQFCPPAPFGLPQTAGIDLNGVFAGSTAGYNYQFGSSIVVGIENDFSWSGNSGSANLVPPFLTGMTYTTTQTWLDTLRARAGYTWNRVLVYGTGGAAFANAEVLLCDPATCASQSRIMTGWTAGMGTEYAFMDHWSVKLEYLHAEFGAHFPRITTTILNPAHNLTLIDDIVRAGVNYKFVWGS
jgi:outer membrane immunogenic protein